MKRFIVALAIMISTVFVFMFDGFSNIESRYIYTPAKTCIYIFNNDMGLIRFANCEEDVPTYMLRQMDLICEIDSVKYYLVD